MHKCAHCKQYFSESNFYKKGNKLWSYCKSCESSRKKQQLVNFKKECLNYKNQHSCQKCGYNQCIGSLHFHHTGDTSKDFSISQIGNLKLNEKIKKELDKCIVLCANCHSEEHYIKSWNFSPNVLKPYSQNYCIDCQAECSRGSQKCCKCENKRKQNLSKKPPKEQLLKDIELYKSNVAISKIYNVSDNTIKKWKKSYNI